MLNKDRFMLRCMHICIFFICAQGCSCTTVYICTLAVIRARKRWTLSVALTAESNNCYAFFCNKFIYNFGYLTN